MRGEILGGQLQRLRREVARHEADALEAQRLLVDWDDAALEEADRLFTTSHVVADRLARYNGLPAEPLYHPPPLADRLHPGDMGRYVFSALRLESNKRPERLVDALTKATDGRGAW